MTELQVSAALLRTLPRLMARADPERDRMFEGGQGTRPVTQAYLNQAASLSGQRIVTRAIKRRPPAEERQKEIGRRRTWAGGGNMPPSVRASYSEAERAALSVIADQCKRRGYCDLCLDEIARMAGVGRTSVQNAIRKARSKENAHISVRERPQRGQHSLTNIIKIVCNSWLGWIARAAGFKRQGGFKRLNASETEVKNSLSGSAERSKWAFEESQPIPEARNRDGWNSRFVDAPGSIRAKSPSWRLMRSPEG